MLQENEIKSKMIELARKLKYEYCNISWLGKAMFAKKIDDESDGRNRKNYTNDALATLGDSVLKLILTEYFYDKKEDKGYITDERKRIENNETLSNMFNRMQFFEYAHNGEHFYCDAPAENKVPNSKHNQYLEAIIGAVYKDKGLEYTKEWVIQFLKITTH